MQATSQSREFAELSYGKNASPVKAARSHTMTKLLMVALGSALGGMARFWLANFVARRTSSTFPWGTLWVNASGALLIGLLAGATRGLWPDFQSVVAAFVLAGFMGSYTTVSSFSLETLSLAHRGAWVRAAGNVVLSLGLCLGGVALGLVAATRLAGVAS
jgi:fluoride exporter